MGDGGGDAARRIAEDGLTLTAGRQHLRRRGRTRSGGAVLGVTPEGNGDESGGLRPISGGALIDQEGLGGRDRAAARQIRELGPVNIEAQVDYESLRERHDVPGRPAAGPGRR